MTHVQKEEKGLLGASLSYKTAEKHNYRGEPGKQDRSKAEGKSAGHLQCSTERRAAAIFAVLSPDSSRQQAKRAGDGNQPWHLSAMLWRARSKSAKRGAGPFRSEKRGICLLGRKQVWKSFLAGKRQLSPSPSPLPKQVAPSSFPRGAGICHGTLTPRSLRWD